MKRVQPCPLLCISKACDKLKPFKTKHSNPSFPLKIVAKLLREGGSLPKHTTMGNVKWKRESLNMGTKQIKCVYIQPHTCTRTHVDISSSLSPNKVYWITETVTVALGALWSQTALQLSYTVADNEFVPQRSFFLFVCPL